MSEHEKKPCKTKLSMAQQSQWTAFLIIKWMGKKNRWIVDYFANIWLEKVQLEIANRTFHYMTLRQSYE